MPITTAQKALAEKNQWSAARDGAPQVRLVAGPGTGKTHTIEKRVADLLNNGATPNNVYVISFTRATCAELRSRVQSFCSNQPCATTAPQIRISTMHSLALRILRLANLLHHIPAPPSCWTAGSNLGYMIENLPAPSAAPLAVHQKFVLHMMLSGRLWIRKKLIKHKSLKSK